MDAREARSCEAIWLGQVPYDTALRLQEESVQNRRDGSIPDRLYLLEHPHVFTLGRGADSSNVLRSEEELATIGATLYHTGRGGDVTYHGPGQLVGYPIISLKPDRCDVHRYVRDLEEVLIGVLAEIGIQSQRIEGLTGVWVGDEKIAAIGVRIARWITSHGFALNVAPDMNYFDAIVPCGIRDHGVTSIERVIGSAPPIEQIAHVAAERFGVTFERTIDYSESLDPVES